MLEKALVSCSQIKKIWKRRLKQLTKERDDLNEKAREYQEGWDELNTSIKENLGQSTQIQR